jgi:hypothetical protein
VYEKFVGKQMVVEEPSWASLQVVHTPEEGVYRSRKACYPEQTSNVASIGCGGFSLPLGNEARRRQRCSYSLGRSALESRSRICS